MNKTEALEKVSIDWDINFISRPTESMMSMTDVVKLVVEIFDDKNEKDFRITGLFLLNRVDYDRFEKLMRRAYGNHLENIYLDHKWQVFQNSMLSFCTIYKIFTEEVEKEIVELDYKG